MKSVTKIIYFYPLYFKFVESNGKLLHLFISSKTVTLVPEFAVEDLPVGRTAALVPEFAVKDLSLGRTLDDDDYEVYGPPSLVRTIG